MEFIQIIDPPKDLTALKRHSNGKLSADDMPIHPNALIPMATIHAPCREATRLIFVKKLAAKGPRRHPMPTEEYIIPTRAEVAATSPSM